MTLCTILQKNIPSIRPAGCRRNAIHWYPGHHPNYKGRQNQHDPERRGVHLDSAKPGRQDGFTANEREV
jgi:hypothetical protein